MFEELLGPGEEEEEEEVVTGDPSTQTGDPPLAGRDPAGQRVRVGCPSSCRTLCHPSFQPFYSAVLGYRHLEDAAREAGPSPFLDCSSFFYTDPSQPPGCRINNWLSSSCSLDVLHGLRLETPAPIMAPREYTPAPRIYTRRRWFSNEELQAVSALLELPAAQAGPKAESGAKQGDP